MNRKAKNIIFFTIVGILIFIFVLMLVLGGIYAIAGSGTSLVQSIAQVFGKGASASRMYTIMKAAPYICIVCGLLLTIMFYKKFNTRIN